MQAIQPFEVDNARGVSPTALDLRWLPPPEPMLRALAAADDLLPGQTAEVITPMLPAPLLELLSARGLQTRVLALADGSTRVLIHCPLDESSDGAAGT